MTIDNIINKYYDKANVKKKEKKFWNWSWYYDKSNLSCITLNCKLREKFKLKKYIYKLKLNTIKIESKIFTIKS